MKWFRKTWRKGLQRRKENILTGLELHYRKFPEVVNVISATLHCHGWDGPEGGGIDLDHDTGAVFSVRYAYKPAATHANSEGTKKAILDAGDTSMLPHNNMVQYYVQAPEDVQRKLGL